VLKSCVDTDAFEGEVRWGMRLISMKFNPIPTPVLPLKGREKYFGTLKLAHMGLRRYDGLMNNLGLT